MVLFTENQYDNGQSGGGLLRNHRGEYGLDRGLYVRTSGCYERNRIVAVGQ